MDWKEAPDIKRELGKLIRNLTFTHIDAKRIVCFRSTGSSSKARARIWSFPRIWQKALNLPAYYIIEVLSRHFDKLSVDDKKRVLIHELLHIPGNFSGSLLSHRGRGRRIDRRKVEQFFKKLKK